MTDPLSLGLTVVDARAQGVGAARGATDFGQYFVYFSFFIVVSALVLAVLFFKLGIEQRVREVGLLRAVGFGPARVRRLFLQEGLLLAVVGSALGIAGALGCGCTSRLHRWRPERSVESSRQSPASGGRSALSTASPSAAC
jgi:cell division protein FtsX